MEARTRRELEGLLRYVSACRTGIDLLPANAAYLRSTTWAYVGGSMAVLRNLDLITDEERHEWWTRIEDVLGPPDGGWVETPRPR